MNLPPRLEDRRHLGQRLTPANPKPLYFRSAYSPSTPGGASHPVWWYLQTLNPKVVGSNPGPASIKERLSGKFTAGHLERADLHYGPEHHGRWNTPSGYTAARHRGG